MAARRCASAVGLSFRKPRKLEVGEVPGSWALQHDRLRRREARRLPDVHFNPLRDRVGLLKCRRFDSIAQQGCEHTCKLLARPKIAARRNPATR